MADHLDLIADIESGHYDDHLIDINQAILARSVEAQLGDRTRWRMTVDGETWDQDSVTAGEVRLVSKTLGVDWAPHPLESADAIVLWVIAHYNKVHGMDLKEAWDKAEAINAQVLRDAVTEYQAEGPTPKDRSASTT